ncbi:type I restriction-modification enzyme R subunit C-terminal domain-containing protein [Phytohabitans flavus]|uniref:type I restriction-modification enzyme R subunit C-terminal domain-containing protein n=1 Tax=Phytohabitans flavus TaxID=1076124 RepID=UPI0015669113|nr:type I restriction-modification enzyme R subunit C-terminal domain-containing protein [Phytohabitans flavus]
MSTANDRGHIVRTCLDVELVPNEYEGLGLYLRSITGIDREAASAALDRFQRGANLNASQLHFLNLLTDFLARNGLVNASQLYEAPFSAWSAAGRKTCSPRRMWTRSSRCFVTCGRQPYLSRMQSEHSRSPAK